MKKIYAHVLGFILCMLTTTAFSQQIYLRADNLTDRAGYTEQFKNYVEITSFQFGVDAPVTTGKSGPSPSKPVFREVIITKYSDISSNKLIEKVALGRPIAKLEIVSTANIEGENVVVHKVELTEAYITEIASSTVSGCTGNCPTIAESYKFYFKTIKITTYSVDERGSVTANAPFEYNTLQPGS